ncbi:MAG: MBL fold metallo-hydrolase [Burkholderiaceae bacterium]|nr:MBL fold metallo-hydrolase [Burkholderiaceae bacterium]
MDLRIALLRSFCILVLVATAQPASAADGAAAKPSVCWVEYGGGAAPGMLGGQGATSSIWRNTASGLLVRHPRGNVLIDAGWSSTAVEDVKGFSPFKAAMASRTLAALSWRVAAPQALGRVKERPEDLAAILPTHAHFDHMAGAVDLPGTPVFLTKAEIDWVARQKEQPDVVPLSNIKALETRFKPLGLEPRPHMGFSHSHDFYGDGTIVVVPLPGHTPGSVGVFVNVGGRTFFDTGDATFTHEALEKGLPKMKLLRDYADNDPPKADELVQTLAGFHKAHPEVAVLPSHDRLSWEKAFGPNPTCTP